MTGRAQGLRHGCALFGDAWCLGELASMGMDQVVGLAVAAGVEDRDVAAGLPRDVLVCRLCESLLPEDVVMKYYVYIMVRVSFKGGCGNTCRLGASWRSEQGNL